MPEQVNHRRADLCLWTMQTAFAREKGLHAKSLLDSLEGLTAEQAAWSPGKDIRSIWEIVNHVAHWKDVVVRFMDNEPVTDDELAGKWPAIPAVSEAQWAKAVAYLEGREAEIEKRLRLLTDKDLDQLIVEPDFTVEKGFIATAAHDCYHTDQIFKLCPMQGI